MSSAAGRYTWDHVAAERRDVLALLLDLSPEEWLAPSLCEGWRVRDVVAHLLVDEPVYELGRLGVLRHMIGWRFDVHKANAWWVERNADRPTDTLVENFNRSLTPGPMSRLLGADNQLRASVIHHEDIRRPLGRPSVAPIERLCATLDVVVQPSGSINLGSSERASNVKLRATDVQWTHGDGPEVTGPALSLLMAVAGRAVALDDLSGDGLRLFSAGGDLRRRGGSRSHRSSGTR